MARGDFMIRILQGWAQSRGIPNEQIADSLTSDVPIVLRPDQLVDLIWYVCDCNLKHKARQAVEPGDATVN